MKRWLVMQTVRTAALALLLACLACGGGSSGASAGATAETTTSTGADVPPTTGCGLPGFDLPFPDLPGCHQRVVADECRGQCEQDDLDTVWSVCGAEPLQQPAPFHPLFLDCACSDPIDMLVVDLDGDGIDDVAATCDEDFPRAVVWFGGAERPMACPWRHAVGRGAHALAAADFDLDGRTDLVALNSFDGTLSVYRGQADHQLAPQLLVEVPELAIELSAYPPPVDMIAGDLDSDGDADLVVFRPPQLTVLRGDGNAEFTSDPPLTLMETCGLPHFIDLDVDGHLDLVVPCTAALRLIRGDGGGHFALSDAPLLPLDNDVAAFTIADMTGDGLPDLLLLHAKGVLFAPAEAPAQFGPLTTLADAPTWQWIGAADVDGKPGLEILVHGDAANDNFDINATFFLVGDVVQGFTVAAELMHPGDPAPPRFGDFNADGRTDLVFGLRGSADWNPGVYFLESAP